MLDVLILTVMLAIVVSLAAGLVFLVRDRGRTERTVVSLSIRVALAVALLALLALGFTTFPRGASAQHPGPLKTSTQT